MESKKSALWSAVVAIALVAPSVAWADKSIEDVKEPDKTTPLSAWTPAQQWMPSNTRVSTHGYGEAAGMLVLADELGGKLSELGRVSLISRCFEYAQADTKAALMWALCGPDVKAFDMKKLEGELTSEGISADSRKRVLEEVDKIMQNAKKVGEAVDAAAKTDPGVAALLELPASARTDWNAYIGKNKDAFERYLRLKDAVRSGKSNHKDFAGCWEATRPAFEKLVKATSFPWELTGDYLPGYMAVMVKSPASYITAASFAACAYSVHESGEALMAAAVNHKGGVIQIGWRSIALAKALDPRFKPKFAERSLRYEDMTWKWKNSKIQLEGLNEIAPIMTPAQGTIATAKADGDVTKITFKGDTVDSCLEWKTTKKVQSVASNGDIQYEKVCAKRGHVANQENDTSVATKFAAGLKPGVDVLLVDNFPVTAWKAKKFVAVFGVAK
jgi:hypothetical protein